MALSVFFEGILGGVKPLPNVILGRNLVRLRNRAGVTQEVLSGKAVISRGYLQELEAGNKNPTINVVERLRKALRCTWSELLRGMD